MTIQWLGGTSFKITGKNDQKEDITILFDPPTNKISSKTDIVCFTRQNSEEQNLGGQASLLISGAGEYEKKGAFLKGFFENNKLFYYLELEEITLAHLGKINKLLEEKVLDQLGEIDILLIGLGPEMQHLINQLEPRVFIPMDYKNGVKVKSDQLLEKLTIKKKDLTNKDAKGIILNKKGVDVAPNFNY